MGEMKKLVDFCDGCLALQRKQKQQQLDEVAKRRMREWGRGQREEKNMDEGWVLALDEKAIFMKSARCR